LIIIVVIFLIAKRPKKPALPEIKEQKKPALNEPEETRT
jgi:hypothetical protein